MKYYGIDLKGLLKIQEVETLPVWTSDYERRIIYNKTDEVLYYGSSDGWGLIGDLHDNKVLLDKFTDVDGHLHYDGSLIGGILTINDGHVFSSTIERDAYFITNPSELTDQLFVVINPNTLYQYRVDTWIDVTTIIRGPTGPLGFGTFTIRAVGPLTEKDSYDNEDEGFSFLAVDTQKLYIRWGIAGIWGGPYDFPNLNSNGMDDWERFPGYTLETTFNDALGTITETLKLTLNDAIFATRITTEEFNTGNLTTTVECPTLSINRQNVMIVSDTNITETITNII